MKRILFLLLSLCAFSVQAGYTNPLSVTETKRTNVLEPFATATVTYHVTSHVHTQSVFFSISLASGAVPLNDGFTCGRITNPAIAAEGSCQFKVRYKAPATPGAYSPVLRLYTEGTDRGGSNGAELTHTTNFQVDSPSALTIVSDHGNFVEVMDGDHVDKHFKFTITNNGADNLTGINYTPTFTPAQPTDPAITQDVGDASCGDLANISLDAGESCTVSYTISTAIVAPNYEESEIRATATHGGGFSASNTVTVMAIPTRTTWSAITMPAGGLTDQYGGVDAYVDPTGNPNYFYLLTNNTVYRTNNDTTLVEFDAFGGGPDFYPTKMRGVSTSIYLAGTANTDYYGMGATPVIYKKDTVADATTFALWQFDYDETVLGSAYLTGFGVADNDGVETVMGLGTDNGFDLFYINGEGGDALVSSYTGLSGAPVDFAIDSVPAAPNGRAFAIFEGSVILADAAIAGGAFGENWFYLPTQPELRANETITSLAVLNDNGAGDTVVVYVGTNRAVYRTTYTSPYQSVQFTRLMDGVNVESLAVTRGNGVAQPVTAHFLYVGTRGEGIYRCDDAEAAAQCTVTNFDADNDAMIALSKEVVKLVNSGAYPDNTVYAVTRDQSNDPTTAPLNVYRGTA